MVNLYRIKELDARIPAGGHVIKAATASGLSGATQLLAEAEDRAAEIVETARDHYEQEKIRGYRDGYNQALLEAVERLLEEEAVLETRLATIDAELADIALACVRKLIGEMADRDLARAYISNAIRQMRRQKRIRLGVSTQQYENIKNAIGGISAELAEIELIDVVENPLLEGTQFIMESEIGRIDGSVEQNLAELGEHLAATLKNRVARLRSDLRREPAADRSESEPEATQEPGGSQ